MRREAIVVAGLLAIFARDVAGRLQAAPEPRPLVPAHGRSVPVLCHGGLACVPGAEVARSGSRPLSPERRLLVSGRVDLHTAQAPTLIAVPGIGPRLAARILAARAAATAQGQRLDKGGLARIRGLGARRAAALEAVLGLDEGPASDICSTGSWPMISSGCDRPR